MSIEVTSGVWPASGAAVGLGVWVFFAWCWLATARERRVEMVACFGLVAALVFGGGLAAGWLLSGDWALSSLGAMVGGALGVGLVVRPWRSEERWKIDHLVLGGIAGLSVARLGCLFEGCDFGRPTEGALAVVHESGTRAFDIHVVHYGLEPVAATSLAVHPFAGYLAAWGMAAAVFGQWRRRRGDVPGRAAMAAAVVFLVGGGAIEWLREPVTVLEISDGVSVYPLLYGVGAVGAALLWTWFGDKESGVET